MKRPPVSQDENVYDTVALRDMEFQDSTFYYPCPCGDLFEISLEDLLKGLRIATCPSCSLRIGVDVGEDDLEEIAGYEGISLESLKILSSSVQVQTIHSFGTLFY